MRGLCLHSLCEGTFGQGKVIVPCDNLCQRGRRWNWMWAFAVPPNSLSDILVDAALNGGRVL